MIINSSKNSFNNNLKIYKNLIYFLKTKANEPLKSYLINKLKIKQNLFKKEQQINNIKLISFLKKQQNKKQINNFNNYLKLQQKIHLKNKLNKTLLFSKLSSKVFKIKEKLNDINILQDNQLNGYIPLILQKLKLNNN
jgi:hypothetical protein